MAITTGTSAPTTDLGWRTRDIVVTAVIGVAFGVFFVVAGAAWKVLEVLGPLQNAFYAVWLLPALVAPLIVRKPGAALFAEVVAAGLSALLGSTWGVDTLLSGIMQGGAAELVFAATRYRSYALPTLGAAGLAAALAAFVHDWWFYYQALAPDALLVMAVLMALSGAILLPLVAVAIVRALRGTGVLDGFPA